MKIQDQDLYFISTTGTDSTGPYTLNQVRGMWNSGTISAATQICSDGETWYPALKLINFVDKWEATAIAAPSRTIYTLLALFFGSVGAHNFYAKETSKGFLKILYSIIGFTLSLTAYQELGFFIVIAVLALVIFETLKGPGK